MMPPELVDVASTSSKVAGAESAGNRRLRPPPATTGLITRVSSSRRPASMSDLTRVGLPETPILPPSCSRSSLTKSTTDPVISVLFAQWSTDVRVVDATYFCVLLTKPANGSSVEVGQYCAHSVKVLRPRRIASWPSSIAPSATPICSSNAGCHSFGDSTTPSMDVNCPENTLRIAGYPLLDG